MNWERVGGLALALGAAPFSYVFYSTYWINPEATTLGKAVNMIIIGTFLASGLFYAMRKDSKTSFSRSRTFIRSQFRVHPTAISEVVFEARKLGDGESLKIMCERGIPYETWALLQKKLGSGFKVYFGYRSAEVNSGKRAKT